MASVQKAKMQRRKELLKTSLENIEWAFQLLAIYTIPILFVSSIILGMQVGGYIDKAGGIGGFVCWLAGAALMTAIELSMLGSFGLAGGEFKNGNKVRGFFLFLMGIAFIIITIVTLSFAKSNASGEADNILSIIRLSASVLYAVLAHGVQIKIEDEDDPDHVSEWVETRLSAFTESMEDRLSTFQTHLSTELQQALSTTLSMQVENAFQSVVTERQIESLIESRMQSFNESFHETLTGFKRTVSVTMEQATQTSQVSKPQEPKTIEANVPRQVRSQRTTPPQIAAPKKAPEKQTRRGEFDKKSFVYACLHENRKQSISSIQKKALEEHNEKLSTGSVSNYRSDFLKEYPEPSTERENGLSVDEIESLIERPDESNTFQSPPTFAERDTDEMKQVARITGELEPIVIGL